MSLPRPIHVPPAVTLPQSNVLPYTAPAILFTGMMTLKTLPSDKSFGLVDMTEGSGNAIQRCTQRRTPLAPLPLLIQCTSFRDCSTRAVHKETELFKIYCFTYNLIKLVSFTVLLSTLDTPRPTFSPVLERVLERL